MAHLCSHPFLIHLYFASRTPRRLSILTNNSSRKLTCTFQYMMSSLCEGHGDLKPHLGPSNHQPCLLLSTLLMLLLLILPSPIHQNCVDVWTLQKKPERVRDLFLAQGNAFLAKRIKQPQPYLLSYPV